MPSDKDRDEALTTPLEDAQRTTPLGSHEPSPAPTKLDLADPVLRALQQRYDILAEVGRGGMGIVYRACDRETGAVVALKVLRPEIAADTAVIERFKSELLLARKITHKNVCRIYELLRFGDAAVISMEYIEGESLRQFLTRYSAVAIRKGVQWASQICNALSEAHGQGIVHRDLKPENIVIDRHGNVKVMDFGIARSIETARTTTGVMVGTPAYMAPEQAEGKPTDTRSDIYSLGLVLYEMFTGQSAFRADTPVAFAMKQIHETPPAPREVEPALPAHVEKAILKCLEKNPAKRFQSVNELEAALTREPEAKPAAVKGEGAEVALPIRLATWQRSDWCLLASGALGAVVFFLLFYRLHPASASVITIGAEEQKQIVADALKKLQWDVKVGGRPWLVFDPMVYYQLASIGGNRAARDRLLHFESIAGWDGNLVSEGERKSNAGEYGADLLGRLHRLELYTPGAGAPIQPGPVPNEASMARMKGIAQSAVSALFGKDLSATKAESRAYWNVPHQQWWAAFQWTLPQQPQGFVEKVSAVVDGSRVVHLSRRADFESPAERAHDPTPWLPPVRYFVAGLVMVLFTLVLFLARKVHREPRSLQNLRLAILIGLGGAVAISPVVVWPGVYPPLSGLSSRQWSGKLSPFQFSLFCRTLS